MLGIFLGAPHPYPHTEERKFNPLQKVSYWVVMYALLPLVAVTGWALFFPAQLPESLFGLRGIAVWAFVHTYIGYFLSLFMIVHIYLGTTGETPGYLFRLMLTGCEPTRRDRLGSEPNAAERAASGGTL